MHTPRLFLLIVMALFSSSLWADSSVFVTNNTPEAVSISVNHYGSRTLSAGDWTQEVTEIPAYQTRRVLRFNRYWGLKSGATYRFDTHVSTSQSSVVLEQKMRGTWYGSTIQHSARANDFSGPWYSDRSIHRHATQYQQRDSQAALSAHFTGGYDDFHYTIHNNTPDEPVSGNDALKVLTYNVYALPFVASDISARLAELPTHMKGYDVVMVQEAFAGSRDGFMLELAQEYPYQTHIPREDFNFSDLNIFDSGLFIASRHPIVNVQDFVYPQCNGTDCQADKSVLYAEIIKDGKAYHVTNTHAASFDTDEARALRMVQFQQIRDLVNDQAIPGGEAVMFGGDLNVNKLKWQDDYVQMLAILDATDPASTGHDATFDPRINELSQAFGSGGDTVEYLDYVVYANDHRQPVASRNDVRVPRSTVDSLWRLWDLSDHFPVMGEFSFE